MAAEALPSQPVSAARQPLVRGKLLYWGTWPVLVALDLWSKAVAFAFMVDKYPHMPEALRKHAVWDGPIAMQLVTWRNPGTIWGLFQDYTIVLIALRVVALGALVYFAWRTQVRHRFTLFVLALLTAGALGNLYDNFFAPEHKVRDFLYFTGTWPTEWTFPAFNVADACITVGAISLAFLLLGEDRAAKAASGRVSS